MACRARRRHRSDKYTEVTSTILKKCGDNPVRSSRLRMLSFSAVAALALYPALSPTIAAETDANQAPAVQAPATQAPATQAAASQAPASPAAASAATGDQAPLVTGAIPPARSRFLALG